MHEKCKKNGFVAGWETGVMNSLLEFQGGPSKHYPRLKKFTTSLPLPYQKKWFLSPEREVRILSETRELVGVLALKVVNSTLK